MPRIIETTVYGIDASCRTAGTHLTDLRRSWRRIRERAGLKDVRIHDLRHSYASRALALGENSTMIGKLLGHTQVQTTARYAHLARDSIQNAAARITGSIGGNLSPATGANKPPSNDAPRSWQRFAWRSLALDETLTVARKDRSISTEITALTITNRLAG